MLTGYVHTAGKSDSSLKPDVKKQVFALILASDQIEFACQHATNISAQVAAATR